MDTTIFTGRVISDAKKIMSRWMMSKIQIPSKFNIP